MGSDSAVPTWNEAEGTSASCDRDHRLGGIHAHQLGTGPTLAEPPEQSARPTTDVENATRRVHSTCERVEHGVVHPSDVPLERRTLVSFCSERASDGADALTHDTRPGLQPITRASSATSR